MHALLLLLCLTSIVGRGSAVEPVPRSCNIAEQGLSVVSEDCSLVQAPLQGPLDITVLGAYNGANGSAAGLEPGPAPAVQVASLADLGVAAGGRVALQHLLVRIPSLAVPLPVPDNTSLLLDDVRFISNSASVSGYAAAYWKAGATNLTTPPVYTDNSSFFHTNYGSRGAGWQIASRSSSLLAGDLPERSRLLQRASNGSSRSAESGSGPQVNYILSATNSTLMPQLLAHAGRVTAEPLIVYITSNITLTWGGAGNGTGSSGLPAGGIPVNRPLILVGSALRNTSIDFGMDVNQLNLLDGSPYAQVVFDSLVLENLGPGDSLTAKYSNGMSLSVTSVMYPVLFDRADVVRVITRNCTVVVASASELDWLSYWAAAWNSPLPYFQNEAAWLRTKQSIKEWLIDTTKTTPRSFNYIRALGRSAEIFDSLLTLDSVVAPPLPLPPPNALHPTLSVTSAAPLVIYADNATLVLLLVSRPAFNPQRPRVLVVQGVMDLVPAARIVSRSSNVSQTGNAADPINLPVVLPITITGVPDDANLLDPNRANFTKFGFTRDVLQIPDTAGARYLELDVLKLTQLPQGPAAVGADGLVPDVFTMLLWSISRPMNGRGVLTLVNVTLLLPAPELQYLHARARREAVFGIRMAGASGDAIAIAGARIDGDAVHFDSMNGYGISATNISLVLDANGSDTQGFPYYWPKGVLPEDAGLPAWAIALIVLAAVFGTLALGLAAWWWCWRVPRRRRQRSKASAETRGTAKPWQNGDMELGAVADGTLGAAQARPYTSSAEPPNGVDHAWWRIHHSISSVSKDLANRRAQATGPPGKEPESVDPAAARTSSSTGVGGSAASNGSADGKASSVASGTACIGGPALKLQLYELLGSGNFASVYRGLWRGTPVAVKVMQLPASSLSSLQEGVLKQQVGQQEPVAPRSHHTRENMAVNEAAISTTVSHPNIVQVYTYTLKASSLKTGSDQHGSGGPASADNSNSDAGILSWELCLVMEYCDQGTLRDALDSQRFHDGCTGRPHHATVMALALDVACAMLHLHSQSILHGDLKTSNVLLKQAPVASAPAAGVLMSVPGGARNTAATVTMGSVPGARLVAKVADFGLSTTIDPGATHLSHVHAGTMSHMAPELLAHGRASKASDVYAFGIMMWELATGGRAFAGTPRALLGHQIVHSRLRPPWPRPLGSPFASAGTLSASDSNELRYQQLAERCWAHEASERPSLGEVVDELSSLLQEYVQLAGDQQQPQQQLHLQQHQQQQFDGELTQPSVRRVGIGGFDATEASWGGEAPAVLPFFTTAPLAQLQADTQQQQQQQQQSATMAGGPVAAAANGAGSSSNDSVGGHLSASYDRMERIAEGVQEAELPVVGRHGANG